MQTQSVPKKQVINPPSNVSNNVESSEDGDQHAIILIHDKQIPRDMASRDISSSF